MCKNLSDAARGTLEQNGKENPMLGLQAIVLKKLSGKEAL
jgi:hypothetical protein